MTNEFEELDAELGELDLNEDAPLNTKSGNNTMISSGTGGVTYDWSKAPDGVKAPPRADLNGQIVTINKAEIILPTEGTPWIKAKKSDKLYKYCTFTLYYDKDGQQEKVSGVRVFQRNEDGVIKYSHPTITRDRKNQASKLLGTYADFKKKDINEITLKELMYFLNSKPKAKIEAMKVENPETEEIIYKNFPVEFSN